MGTDAGGLPLPRTREEWEKSLDDQYTHAVPILYVATLEKGSTHAMPKDAFESLVEFLRMKGYEGSFGRDGCFLLDNKDVVSVCLGVMETTTNRFDYPLGRTWPKVEYAEKVLGEFWNIFEAPSLVVSFEGLYESLPMFSGAAHVLFNVLQASLYKERELIPRHEPFSLFADPSLYKTVAWVDMPMLLEHLMVEHQVSRRELPRFIVLPFRLATPPDEVNFGGHTHSFSIVPEPPARRTHPGTTTLEVTTRRKGLN